MGLWRKGAGSEEPADSWGSPMLNPRSPVGTGYLSPSQEMTPKSRRRVCTLQHVMRYKGNESRDQKLETGLS